MPFFSEEEGAVFIKLLATKAASLSEIRSAKVDAMPTKRRHNTDKKRLKMLFILLDVNIL